jgi:CDGSH-type Zn-finger protein
LENKAKIVVSKDGPYIVTGNVPLSIRIIVPNQEGFSWEWKEGESFTTESGYRLCRCGRSKNKPFCDDTHETIAFVGEETASTGSVAAGAREYPGPALTLQDAESLCAHARFCMAEGKIWHLVKNEDPASRGLAVREANHCPSGRLVVRSVVTRVELEQVFEPSIGVVEDPVKGCSGPLWVRGGIRIESADGVQYEARNRATLCRCGFSNNKPFCDGSHKTMKFKDGMMKF